MHRELARDLERDEQRELQRAAAEAGGPVINGEVVQPRGDVPSRDERREQWNESRERQQQIQIDSTNRQVIDLEKTSAKATELSPDFEAAPMDVDAQAAVQYSRAASEEKLQQKTEERFKDLAEFEAETGLKKGTASGNGNNCLINSVMQCEGRLHWYPKWHTVNQSVLKRCQKLREELHGSLLSRLQPEAPDEGWDHGFGEKEALSVMQRKDFLKAAHTHELANRFGKSIVVLQGAGVGSEQPGIAGEPHLSVTCYAPGWDPESPVKSKERVKELLQEGALCVHLSGRHFEPMLSEVLREKPEPVSIGDWMKHIALPRDPFPVPANFEGRWTAESTRRVSDAIRKRCVSKVVSRAIKTVKAPARERDEEIRQSVDEMITKLEEEDAKAAAEAATQELISGLVTKAIQNVMTKITADQREAAFADGLYAFSQQSSEHATALFAELSAVKDAGASCVSLQLRAHTDVGSVNCALSWEGKEPVSIPIGYARAPEEGAAEENAKERLLRLGVPDGAWRTLSVTVPASSFLDGAKAFLDATKEQRKHGFETTVSCDSVTISSRHAEAEREMAEKALKTILDISDLMDIDCGELASAIETAKEKGVEEGCVAEAQARLADAKKAQAADRYGWLRHLAEEGDSTTREGRSKFAIEDPTGKSQSDRTNGLAVLRELMDDDVAYIELGHPDVGRPDTKGTTKAMTAGKKTQLLPDWEISEAPSDPEKAKDFKWLHVKVMEKCVQERAQRGDEEGYDVVLFESKQSKTSGHFRYLLSPLAREMRKKLAADFMVSVARVLPRLPHLTPYNWASSSGLANSLARRIPSSAGEARGHHEAAQGEAPAADA